jgi:hypothetical protein
VNKITDRQSIRLAYNIFDALEMCDDYNQFIPPPHDLGGYLRGKSYVEQWKIYSEKYWYDLKLSDGSLLLFESKSYRYIMAPVRIPTQDEFFASVLDGFTQEEQEEFISSPDFSVDFETYVNTATSYSSYTPLRYDFSLSQSEYCKHTHPAFHLHIGFENESRIPVKIRLTPFSFSIFVLSTFYPKKWRFAVEKGLIDQKTINNMKHSSHKIVNINRGFWCLDNEEPRLYLG